jgi:hypothetical protein
VVPQGLELLLEPGLRLGAEGAQLSGRLVDGFAEAFGRAGLGSSSLGRHQRKRQRKAQQSRAQDSSHVHQNSLSPSFGVFEEFTDEAGVM